FHADDDFPVAARAFDQFRFAVCEIHRLSWASRLRTGASPSQCAHAPCHTAAAFARRGQRGTPTRRGRWPREPGLSEVRMADNRARNGKLSALLGLLIALAAIGQKDGRHRRGSPPGRNGAATALAAADLSIGPAAPGCRTSDAAVASPGFV